MAVWEGLRVYRDFAAELGQYFAKTHKGGWY
jgi:hypothetical protein